MARTPSALGASALMKDACDPNNGSCSDYYALAETFAHQSEPENLPLFFMISSISSGLPVSSTHEDW